MKKKTLKKGKRITLNCKINKPQPGPNGKG